MNDASEAVAQTAKQAEHATQNEWMQHLVSSSGLQQYTKTQSDILMHLGRQVYRHVLASISRMLGAEEATPKDSDEVSRCAPNTIDYLLGVTVMSVRKFFSNERSEAEHRERHEPWGKAPS